MGLKQNTVLLAQLPLRLRGGDPGTLRPMWGRTDLRNQTVGQGISTELAGIPSGHLSPSAWVLPYKSGAMSAFTYKGITFTVDPLNVAAGINITGPTTITFTVGPSQLDLVVSAIGESSITFTVGGTLAGALSAVGSSTVTFTVGPSTLGAIIDAVASALVQFTTEATPRATGNIEGAVTPFTELSPQNLAAAVWRAIATDYNDTGTMGNKLNLASSGGIDYDALAEAVWEYVNRTLTDKDGFSLTSAYDPAKVEAPSAATVAAAVWAAGTRSITDKDGFAPSASTVASAVLSAAQAAPIHADMRKVNNYTVDGQGTESDPWGPA